MQSFLPYLPVIAVALIWAERMREVATKRDTVPGHRRELWTFTLFMICGVLMLAGAMVEYFVGGKQPVWPLFVLGLLCGIGSFIIRRQAIVALGKFWSLHSEIRDSHEFVRSGPFRRMRHPVYFSMILELLAGGLLLVAPITSVIVFAIFIPTLMYRIRIEEESLVGKFGEDYRAYQRSVPALLPKLRVP